jgi:YidC/Oxa1 family membrane protein insertase
MNFKELIIPLVVALLGTWAIQYFFFNKNVAPAGARIVQPFVAPSGAQEARPLNTEIDFIDIKRPKPVENTEVETDGAKLVFSTDGASLDSLEFKRQADGRVYGLNTIYPVAENERENRCFLVAFDQKTPYYFALVNRNDSDEQILLTYQTETDEAVLNKTFIIYKHLYQIDLELSITPKVENISIGNLRVFFPSPLMPELENYDTISAIVGGDQGSIQKTLLSRVNVHQGWTMPTLFGTESRYFVHALVKDPQAFCQRAYYKLYDRNRMTSILEGPAVVKSASWHTTFYFGPKELPALIAVDKRLESLDYSGILGPLAKWFLALLQWIYSYCHNYGLAIIILAILIRLLLLPLTIKAESSQKKNMELQKKLDYIKHRYKDDPERFKQEQAELIAKYGLPGLTGCLPLLLQLPIFFALNRVLTNSIYLYHSSFLWIPDLAMKDPWYILPVVTALAMIATMRSMGDTRQQMSSIIMAVVMGIVTMSLASGLALYIVVGTLLGLVQSSIQKRFA